MISSEEIEPFVFEQFLLTTTAYVDALIALAEQARASEPGTAELLQAFAEAHAGQGLDLVSQWP